MIKDIFTQEDLTDIAIFSIVLIIIYFIFNFIFNFAFTKLRNELVDCCAKKKPNINAGDIFRNKAEDSGLGYENGNPFDNGILDVKIIDVKQNLNGYWFINFMYRGEDLTWDKGQTRSCSIVDFYQTYSKKESANV